jgi:hypothetical protein
MGDNKISEAVRQLAYETGMWYSQNEKCQPGVPFYAFTQGELDRFVEKLSHLQGEAVPVESDLTDSEVLEWFTRNSAGNPVNERVAKAFNRQLNVPSHFSFIAEKDRAPYRQDTRDSGAVGYRHPKPAELSEVSGGSGELPPEEVTLKQVIDGYVATYGSLRQAAELLCIDPAYLSRLAGCRKTNPSDEVLGKLGLERRVVYTRKVHDYQPTKLHQRTKCA